MWKTGHGYYKGDGANGYTYVAVKMIGDPWFPGLAWKTLVDFI
jgi:hypothetical protein